MTLSLILIIINNISNNNNNNNNNNDNNNKGTKQIDNLLFFFSSLFLIFVFLGLGPRMGLCAPALRRRLRRLHGALDTPWSFVGGLAVAAVSKLGVAVGPCRIGGQRPGSTMAAHQPLPWRKFRAPKDCCWCWKPLVIFSGFSNFLGFFRVVSSDYGKPRRRGGGNDPPVN